MRREDRAMTEARAARPTVSRRGAIPVAAPHGRRANFQRPRNRADGLRGLCSVDGVTHPVLARIDRGP